MDTQHTRVIALVPAHNEQATIADTLYAVMTQSRPPDQVVLIADNCTDLTESIALEMGASVLRTVNNRYKKGGGLNQAVEHYIGGMRDTDVFVGFDADTIPHRDFIRNALRHHAEGKHAVGAVFHGRNGFGFIGQIQRNEFVRFADTQKRRGHRVDVLSGTGWSYTVASLRKVIDARNRRQLPCADYPQVWYTGATVEDFELTLAMRYLKIPMISPPDCMVTTDVMRTWKDLYTQRLRWQRGTLDELRRYGWQRCTRMLILKQIMVYLTILVTPVFAAYLITQLADFGWQGIEPTSPVWSGLGLFLLAENVWSTRKAGRAGVLIAASIVPEYFCNLARNLLYIRALGAHLLKTREVWGAGHVDI